MSDLKWTDTTSYARGERGTVPARTWYSREIKGIRRPIEVTRHHGIPDVWHLTCHGLGPDGFPLQAKDIEAAKSEAVNLIKSRLCAAIEDLA